MMTVTDSKNEEGIASAGLKMEANAIGKKSNDFEKIIEKCGIEVEEDDLLKLLDAKLDIFSKMYFVIIGLFIQGILLLRGIGPIETSSPLIAASFIIGLLFAMGGLVYSFYIFVRDGPFQTQRDILQEFIDARTRLRELKK